MRAYARKLGHDEETWGIVGLLHDFDYQRWPDPPDHPLKGSEILRSRGYPEDVIYAILSHADYLPDYPRVHPVDKALYACDELAGLITATALLRPGGITDLTAASVKKKIKKLKKTVRAQAGRIAALEGEQGDSRPPSGPAGGDGGRPGIRRAAEAQSERAASNWKRSNLELAHQISSS